MIDPYINIENYFKWLIALSAAIEEYPILIKRNERIAYGLYLIRHRRERQAKQQSTISDKLQTAWAIQGLTLKTQIDASKEIISGFDLMNQYQAKGLFTFIPDAVEISNIENMRGKIFASMRDNFAVLLEYPVLPVEQLIKSKLNELTYKHLELYTDPDKKPIISFAVDNVRVWRISNAFDLANDLANYDFAVFLQKYKPSKSAKMVEGLFTSPEAETIFFDTLIILGLMNQSKVFLFPDKSKKPATIKGLIEGFNKAGIIRDSLTAASQFEMTKQALNLTDVKPPGRHTDREPKISIRIAKDIEAALKQHFPKLFYSRIQ